MLDAANALVVLWQAIDLDISIDKAGEIRY